MKTEVERLHRAYRALSACNAAVVSAVDEQALIGTICQTLVETAGYRLAWVGYPDPQGPLRVAAFAGADEGYLATVNIDCHDPGSLSGPTGQALFEGRLTVNRDTRTSPGYDRWRAAALRHGFASSIAMPLSRSGVVLGALTVYATEPDAFDGPECELLTSLALAAAHGIGALRDRATLAERDQQLRTAAKMEALGQLAGGLVHDIRNLLTAISLNSVALRSPALPEVQRAEALEDIVTATQSAAQLTRQLLSFSRRSAAEVAPVRLGPELHRMERLVRSLVGARVVVQVEQEPDLPPTVIDPVQLEEVLVNLALNARDAMAGVGHLTITLRRATQVPACATPQRETSGPQLELAVQDTGSGMSPEVMRHLFEPFFTTKPVGLGTGLGLASIFAVVNGSGGQIAVESEPGRGSTFRVFLPVWSEGARGAD